MGLPAPKMRWDDHDNDIAMRSQAIGQGARVYKAPGARQRVSACNKFGQVPEVPNLFIRDGSQLTSGGAESTMPTLMTLAHMRIPARGLRAFPGDKAK